jgi:endonuclease YncB( thermonuclease family)
VPRGPARLARRLAVLAAFFLAAPPISDFLAGLRPVTDGCRVVHVVDGDTLDLRCPSEGIVRARVTGFDTPELYSPRCASEAARAVAAQSYLRWTLARADRLEVILGGTDRYGRRLVEMRVDGARLADIMVEAGHARRYGGEAREGWCA